MKSLLSMLVGIILWLPAGWAASAAPTAVDVDGGLPATRSLQREGHEPSAPRLAAVPPPSRGAVSEASHEAQETSPWWRTWWSGWAACAVGVVAAVGRRRVESRRVRAQLETHLQTSLDERLSATRQEQDDLLQGMLGVLFLVQAAHNCQPTHPQQAAALLARALEQGEEVVRDAQAALDFQISDRLSRGDFIEAIVRLARDIIDAEERLVREFRIYQEGPARVLHPLLRDELYRIISAAVRAACVNAKPDRIEVELDFNRESLRVRVRDDGIGLVAISNGTPSLVEGRTRRRMSAVRRRVRALGGRFRAWSRRRAGTEIELTFRAPEAYSSPAGFYPWLWNMTTWSWTP